MNRLPNAVQRLMIALLVSMMAVPAASPALFLRNEQVTTGSDAIIEINKQALQDRSKLRRQRRAYWRAIEHYETQRRYTDDIAKPDINDPASIERTLATDRAPQHVEQETDVSSLTTDQLRASDRSLLRRYTRAGTCPETLRKLPIAGFYELCRQLVGESAKSDPVVGLLNHSAYIYRKLRPASSTQPSFKLRMQMMKEAFDRSNRRESVPYARPTKCFGGFEC